MAKNILVYGILDKLKLQKRFCTLFSKLNQFTAWWIISNCDCTSWYVLSEVFTRTGTQKIVYWFEQVMTTIKNLLPKVYVGETKLYDKYEIMRICIIMQFSTPRGKILSHYAIKFHPKQYKNVSLFTLHQRLDLHFRCK